MKNFGLILLGAALIYSIGHATGERDDLAMQQAEYCEMVELFKQTNGDAGWPDYRNIYSEQCK